MIKCISVVEQTVATTVYNKPFFLLLLIPSLLYVAVVCIQRIAERIERGGRGVEGREGGWRGGRGGMVWRGGRGGREGRRRGRGEGREGGWKGGRTQRRRKEG